MVGPGHLPQHVRLYLPATAIYWRPEGMRVSGEARQPLAVSPRLGRLGLGNDHRRSQSTDFMCILQPAENMHCRHAILFYPKQSQEGKTLEMKDPH